MGLNEARDYCGVFGIFNSENAVEIAHKGIRALQHRGEESWGMASIDDGVMHVYRRMGLVPETAPRLKGNSAIAHTRYSTASTSDIGNAQPIPIGDSSSVVEADDFFLYEQVQGNPIAACHNGNLTAGVERAGRGSDTKRFMQKMGNPPGEDVVPVVSNALSSVEGAFSFLFLTSGMMMGARDPAGYRPLSLGRLQDSFVLSSETSAIGDVDGEFIRDISPGELISVTDTGIFSRYIGAKKELSECVFELVYLARPDSVVFGQSVYNFRKDCGRQLAAENPEDKKLADIVVAIPSAGDIAAVGYSWQSRIPLERAIFRNHYYSRGRAFIQPTQEERERAIQEKLVVIKEAVYRGRILLVDDSVVSGTNVKSVVKRLREYGVREIHLRVASPPYVSPCYWGVDTPSVERFIAHQKNLNQIARELDVDSAAYLSQQGMLAQASRRYDKCVKCFEGR